MIIDGRESEDGKQFSLLKKDQGKESQAELLAQLEFNLRKYEKQNLEMVRQIPGLGEKLQQILKVTQIDDPEKWRLYDRIIDDIYQNILDYLPNTILIRKLSQIEKKSKQLLQIAEQNRAILWTMIPSENQSIEVNEYKHQRERLQIIDYILDQKTNEVHQLSDFNISSQQLVQRWDQLLSTARTEGMFMLLETNNQISGIILLNPLEQNIEEHNDRKFQLLLQEVIELPPKYQCSVCEKPALVRQNSQCRLCIDEEQTMKSRIAQKQLMRLQQDRVEQIYTSVFRNMFKGSIFEKNLPVINDDDQKNGNNNKDSGKKL